MQTTRRKPRPVRARAGATFGPWAKKTSSNLAFGKTVEIIERDKDRHGRSIAEVILPDGRSLNREMVGEGMSGSCVKYAPMTQIVVSLEQEARQPRRGLWVDKNP
jgi:micrococcal nuclease